MDIEMDLRTLSKDYKPVNESKLKNSVVLFFKQFGLRRARGPLYPFEQPTEAPFLMGKQELEGLGLTELRQKTNATQMRLPEMEDKDSFFYDRHGPKFSIFELDARRSYVTPHPRELPARDLEWEIGGDSIIGSGFELSGTRFSTATGSGIRQAEYDLPENVQQTSVPPSIPRQWEDEMHTSPHSALHSPEPLGFPSKSKSSYSRRPSEIESPMDQAADFDPLLHKAELASQGAAYLTDQRSSSSAPIQHMIPRKPVANANCHLLPYLNPNSDELLEPFSSTDPDEIPVTQMAVGSHREIHFEERFVLDLPKPLEDSVSSTQNTAVRSFTGNRLIAPADHLDSNAWNRETIDDSISSKSHHGPVDLRIQIPLPSSGRHNMGHCKQDIVEKFCSIVQILAGLWAERLDKCPALFSMTANLYRSPPLQTGLNVLRRFLSSDHSIPTTTIETFHFVHIAFACAYLTHSEEGWYPWGVFY